MPPGGSGLFGSSLNDANHPHLKGEDDEESMVLDYHSEQFDGLDARDLVEMLKDTDSLHEQADIIHYLFTTK